jgi:hypothetical protein
MFLDLAFQILLFKSFFYLKTYLSGTPQISGICRVLLVSGPEGSQTPNPTKKGVYFLENVVFISFKRGIPIFHKKLQKVQNLQKKWYFIDTQETSQN